MPSSRLLSKTIFSAFLLTSLLAPHANAQLINKATRDAKRANEIKETQKTFSWWPTDAKPGPAEIQVVGAAGPVRGTDAEHVLAVRRLYIAHRAIAALAGLQA